MSSDEFFGRECYLDKNDVKQFHYPYIIRNAIEGNRCERCGNAKLMLFPCSNCNRQCQYCRSCLQSGVAKSCRQIIRSSLEQPTWHYEDAINWEKKLTKEQLKAAKEIITSIKQKSNHLLWAVCGAGKSEMLYPSISYALQNGLSVCWATPRRDVVLELLPRLQEIFSTVKIHALYGGSKDNGRWAPLTLTTTHQLIHFYRAFDVMILDEADAFPYNKDPNLPFYLKKASKENTPLITVTATPTKAQQKEAGNLSLLPARYHRHPLPIPTMKLVGNWKKYLEHAKISSHIISYLMRQTAEHHPTFFFIPHAELIEKVVYVLQLNGSLVEGVHSQDPDRKEKVERFRKGEWHILVTTTILERGVTIPNASVAVLGAEEEVFTESALVQICGRGGRSKEAPTSDIVYFHNGITQDMKASITHMKKMNEEALKRGLLE